MYRMVALINDPVLDVWKLSREILKAVIPHQKYVTMYSDRC